jgi:UDP-galactopyranose mutase
MHSETIVAFSPLRWTGTPHRTQQILSRLASTRRVLVIEDPIYKADTPPHWEFASPTPRLTVCRPHLPANSQKHQSSWKTLLHQLKTSYSISNPVGWLATPLALPLLNEFSPSVILYDAIDELNCPRGTTTQWLDMENKVLSKADAVFTSGYSLYQMLRQKHSNVHCLPSSADINHFKQARTLRRMYEGQTLFTVESHEPEGHACLPHPRLGYCGVLDKRIDFELIDLVARTRPEWQVVLVGPLVDLKPSQLPRQPNLHYLGPRPYDQLPAYIAGWDAALMPFVCNDSTRYLNPTTTMEYMAAERLIVTTRVADVVKPYCGIVFVGHSPNTFIVGCEEAITASETERLTQVRLMREALTLNSWQATVRSMDFVLTRVLEQQRRTPLFEVPSRSQGKWAPVT